MTNLSASSVIWLVLATVLIWGSVGLLLSVALPRLFQVFIGLDRSARVDALNELIRRRAEQIYKDDRLIGQLRANIVSRAALSRVLGVPNSSWRLYNYPYATGDIRWDADSPGLTDKAFARAVNTYESDTEAANQFELELNAIIGRHSIDRGTTQLFDLFRSLRSLNPRFNMYPLGWDDLREWAESLKIEVRLVPSGAEMCNLSGLGLIRSGSTLRTGIFVREDLPLPLRTFLLAHELGHYFIHVDGEVRKSRKSGPDLADHLLSDAVVLYTSYNDGYSQAEFHADVFALVALLPTPLVAWLDTTVSLEGGERELEPRDFYVAQAHPAPFVRITDDSPQLRETMDRLISKRIRIYRKFRKLHLNAPSIKLETISSDMLPRLTQTLWHGRCWILTTVAGVCIEASTALALELGRTPSDLVGSNLQGVVDADHGYLQVPKRLELAEKKRRRVFSYVFFRHADGRTITATMITYPVTGAGVDVTGLFSEVTIRAQAVPDELLASSLPELTDEQGKHIEA